jgi:hypothetical protein
MDSQTAVLIALGITLATSGIAVVLLAVPLHATIADPARTVPRAQFWRGYFGLVVVLVPLVTLLYCLPVRTRAEPWALLQVTELARAPLAALAGTLLLLGLMVLVVPGGPGATVAVSPEQADDLGRLLAKVEVIRARETLRREAEEAEHGDWSG